MSQETLNMIMTMVVLPLLTAVSGFVVAYLQKKTKALAQKIQNEKVQYYVYEAADAILAAVEMVSQTYVSELKEKGEFDKAAQKEAFYKAKTAAMKMLSDEAVQILSAAYGDFDAWVESKIEQLVAQTKLPVTEEMVVQ